MKSTKMLNEDNVKFLCGLIRDVRNIDHLLNDLAISNTQTFSSLKITELAQEVKHSLEQYIQSSINGLTHLKKKIVDVLPSDADAEENILYLVKDASVVDDVVYNQYLLIDGVLEPLGRTSTDLSNVYLKDEADAKFALISNLQTLIDMIGNASDLATTKKDTLVNAINEIKEGLDDCIKKDAIVTTLDDTVTNEQVVGALALKELLDEKNVENLFPIQYYNNTSDVRNGITATINNDRSITFKGTTTEQYFFVLWHKDKNGLGKAVALRGKTITMTGGLASPTLSLAFYDEEGNNITPPDNAMKYDFGNGLTIKVPDNAYSVYSYYYSSAGAKLDCTVYPMLEIGNVAHDYCPPNGTALTKGDIGDSINSDSTSDEIVSAKLAYTNFIRGNSASQSYLDEIGTNDVLQFPEGKYTISESVTYTNLPEGVKAGYLEIWNMNGRSYETPFNSIWKYRVVKLQDFNTKKSYYRVLRSGESAVFLDTGWQRVCVATVADVSRTKLTFSDETYCKPLNTEEGVIYEVKNGICFVYIKILNTLTSTDLTYKTFCTGLPKPSTNIGFNTADRDFKGTGASFALTLNGELQIICTDITNVGKYYTTFSYPVAE